MFSCTCACVHMWNMKAFVLDFCYKQCNKSHWYYRGMIALVQIEKSIMVHVLYTLHAHIQVTISKCTSVYTKFVLL